ncbi:MAG: sugar porter family MFS transporter [Acidobacteriota bacterium]|nr:sugar porter family MFS transporter [Acidobacteriota bacterium]
MNALLWRSAITAALGGLLFGFDTAVIAGVTGDLTRVFSLSPLMLGVTVSSALWGTVLGALFGGIPGDKWGRRGALQGLALFYVISALGCALAWGWWPLLIFRIIGGLAIGGSSVIGPMYIAEIAPARARGRMVGLFQFNVVFGILVAYFSNYLVGLAGFGDAEWRWKLGVAAAPAVFFMLMLFSIPQSPRWLAGKGREEEARRVLQQIGEENVEGELAGIVGAIHREELEHSQRLFCRQHRLPVFLAISIGLFNQFSGINAILYYLNDIFQKGGFSKVSSDLQAVAIGLTNLIFTMIAMSIIDKAGRRTLLLTGSIGTAFCLGGVAWIFSAGAHESWLIWLLVGFIAFFAFSQGAVIWVYLSEVFPTLVRAKGQSLGSFSHWAMNALISAVFPLMAARFVAAPFLFFAVMMVAQFVVVYIWYPETKGVSLEELQKKLAAA